VQNHPTIHISRPNSPQIPSELDMELINTLKELRDQRQEDQELIEKLRKVILVYIAINRQ
jgi:hypothetical protein